MNGSLHWLTYKRNIFTFDVKREIYCLFPPPPPISEGNDRNDIGLVEYKRQLVMTCIDRKNDSIEVWIMESYNGR